MTLFIDETEKDEYFIVAGLLVYSDPDVELAYKKFKNSIKGLRISDKAKSRMYVEFKSTVLDRCYQKVKIKLLENISAIDAEIVYSVYKKKNIKLYQSQKESIYITLISNIMNSLQDSTHVVFDRFGIPAFEERIKKLKIIYKNVDTISEADSQVVHGFQLADNICSTIRLHITKKDQYGFFKIIESKTREV